MSKPLLTVDVEVKTGPGQWSRVGTITRLHGAKFEYVTDGLYGIGSISLMQKIDDDGLEALTIPLTKRLLFRLNGTVVYVGLIRRPVRNLDQVELQEIELIGLLDEMNNTWVRKQYVPSGGLQDLSWFYYRLAQDYLLPLGYCDHLEIEEIGILRGSITFDGPLRQCVTDIGTLAPTYVYWGLRYNNSDGSVTFFVHRRDSNAVPTYEPIVAQADYDPATDTYAAIVQNVAQTLENQDLVNRLWITGGDVTYPNLFTVNPSFEDVKQGGSSSSNMLKNGDFDESNAGAWSLAGGASIHSQDNLPGHTPPNYLELDHDGEEGGQIVRGVVAGHTYGFDFQIANEAPTLGSQTLYSEMIYYGTVDGSGASLNGPNGDQQSWAVDGFTWQGRTHLTQAPAGALSIKVMFIGYHTTNHSGHGIAVDTAILYDYGSVYQNGWRMESTPTAQGTDINSDPTGIYVVDWTYDYSRFGAVSPGLEYGAYGVHLHVFGLVPGTNGVRVMNSIEGETQVTAEQFYTVAVTARAAQFDGSAPASGNNFRVGLIWFDDSTPPVPRNLTVQDVHLTDQFRIVGGLIQLPRHTTKVRMYFEALANDLDYYIDGANLSQSPSLPVDFIDGTKSHYVITVQDVYPSTDPHYHSLSLAPLGYGPIDEIVETPIVIDRADAKRYAKTIFDARSLPQSTQTVHIIQTDYPVTLYQPNGYLQLVGLSDYTFPKLWPAQIGYEWNKEGLVCDIDLERESPHLDQVIEQLRRLAIIKVGTGVDIGLFVSAVYDEFTVVAGDTRLSSGGQTITLESSQPITTPEALVFVRGFGQFWSTGEIAVGPDSFGAMQQLTITLPPGDAFSTDDKILFFYYPPSANHYALYVTQWTATGTGTEQFTLPSTAPPMLPGSARPFVRGFATPPSAFNVILDETGQPTILEIEASESLAPGDTVTLLYDADPAVPRVPAWFESTLVGTETTFIFTPPPFQWPDGTWAAVAWLRGMILLPTITEGGGTVSFALPAISAGDQLLVRWSAT